MSVKHTGIQSLYIMVSALILVICFSGFYQFQQQRVAAYEAQMAQKLQLADRLISRWFQEQRQRLNGWTHYPRVLSAAEQLTQQPRRKKQLLAHPEQTLLREFFAPLLKASHLDHYMLIDSRGFIRAAPDNRLLDQPSPIASQPALFAPLWAGSNQWLLPYPSPYPVPDEDAIYRDNQPMLLIAAPVSNGLDVQSALVVTVSLRRELHRLMQDLVADSGLMLTLQAKNQRLTEVGRLPGDTDRWPDLLEARLKQSALPITLHLSGRFDYSRQFLPQQHLLLVIGSLSLLSLISLLVQRSAGRYNRAESSLPQLLFRRGRIGILQLDDEAVVRQANPAASRLLSGQEQTCEDTLTTLLTEYALMLQDDTGQRVGDLKSLLQMPDDRAFYAWWSAKDKRRLLALRQESLAADQGSVLTLRDVTDSRQAFLQLRRQSRALDSAHDMVLWAGADGRIISANRTTTETLGYSDRELTALMISDLDSSVSEERWPLICGRVFRGDVLEYEGLLVRRNGLSFPVDVQIRDDSDGVGRSVCLYLKDISRRKRLESDLHRHRMQLTEKLSVTSQELAVREAENEALIESLPDFLIVFNARFEVISYQHPKGESPLFTVNAGQRLSALFPQLAINPLKQALEDSGFEGLARYFTEMTREYRGQQQILELRFMRTGTHKILLLVRDISTRKREEYFRQFNNRLLMTISDMQTQFISGRNRQLDFMIQLKALVKLAQSDSGLCWLSDSLQQRLAAAEFRYFIPDGAEGIPDNLQQVLEQYVQRLIAQWRAAQEVPEPALIPLSDLLPDTADAVSYQGFLVLPVVSNRQPLICFGLLLQDYRHWTAEIRLFNPWLSTCAALMAAYDSETERLWAEKNLQTEKERAEHASQAKTQFLSRMSHEFRTPLNAILGFSHLLNLEEAFSEEHREHLQQIIASGETLLELVDDVLDLAQLERKELRVELTRIHLTQLVTEVVAEEIDAIAQADLRFAADLPEEDFYVRGDVRRLRQVIHSLLSNAIRYTPAGGHIQIRQIRRDGWCELSVEDNGRGIEKDFLEKIFMPFEVVEGYINAQGIGNGLAVAHHALEAMGGSIRVTSEPGVGSCFTLSLPCCRDQAGSQNDASGSESVTTDSTAEPALPDTADKPWQVLYVEDDAASRKVMERLLHHLDPAITFRGASGAAEAIALTKEQMPDLLLLDMNLGEVSGRSVLDSVRQLDQGQDLPVVAVSGDVAQDQIDEALEAGFDDYLCKPVSLDLLTSVIRRYRS